MNNLTLKSIENTSLTDKITKVAVAKGDGIGPEIMDATLRVLEAAGAGVQPEFIDLGESVYLSGESAGISDDAWETIAKHKLILKAPITTPQGKGFKSLNVTLRKSLSLFANVRPVVALDPFINTGHPKMDVVIIRENEEDLYAGIEHRQTQDVVQCLKLITRPGCERIIRYAFEYARIHKRSKVTCLLKDNIMKLTDGLFHRVFDEIALEYPNIASNCMIIDIGAARLASRPEDFDVVVTSNLYGDIVSDIVAEIAGSVGIAGSANIGSEVAMFEAIHGSAPDIAGQKIANPSGLINAAVMMLAHVGKTHIANRVKNAWLSTIEDGIHTADIYKDGWSKKLVSTSDFANAVIERLDSAPRSLKASTYSENSEVISVSEFVRARQEKVLVGVDVFLDWPGSDADFFGKQLNDLPDSGVKLKMITNRGVKVYPNGNDLTYCTDHWRCRFVASLDNTSSSESNYSPIEYNTVVSLLQMLNIKGFDVIKTENLYEFDGVRGFSLGQGE